jgi:CheY-like chemotaxis protein
MDTKLDFSNYFFADTSFDNLMQKRIRHVLLICSNYDAFILEEDGRINEQVFNEYVALNLRYPPVFFQASTPEDSYNFLHEYNIDLVITMLNLAEVNPIDLAQEIKQRYPSIPLVVLTPFSREVNTTIRIEEYDFIDYVFSWLGNSSILVAIIKLIEDKMNAEHDIHQIGVQAILLVEDSVRYYSSYLPNIYKIVFFQSKEFMTEGLNEHQQMLRLRGRPKILLATTYEEAVYLYEKYKENLLGVISDMSFLREGVKDPMAGFKFCKKVKGDDINMPFLLQSSDLKNAEIAKKCRVSFIHKYSKTLLVELKNFINEYLAFGDFVFIDPDQKTELIRAKDLQELQQRIFEVPDNTLQYHISHNHFSKWLRARALFSLAGLFRQVRAEDFSDLDEIRRFLFDSIAKYRYHRSRGVIADFERDRFNKYLIFSRIGQGSLGGKARGLAFLNSMIKRNDIIYSFPGVIVNIPRTVVIATDIFDEFIEANELYRFASSEVADDDILKAFVNSRLPYRIHEDLFSFLGVIQNPLAIRSSSLLEDSYYQPFAGIYSTYMIPRIVNDERLMIDLLSNAIKSVYASVYFKESKSYMSSTSNVIDEEKMAVVLQEVVGKQYGSRFYPLISGVARSINFYPIGSEKAEDGICNIAFGLGKYIVDGGMSLRFSPKHPHKIIQLSSPELAIRDTQKVFYSLDLEPQRFIPSTDDSINLHKLSIKEAASDKVLQFVSSSYDMRDNIIKEGQVDGGIPVITFSRILQHNMIPLAEIVDAILEAGEREMGNPVEIEFAVNLDVPKFAPVFFHLLQIRPIVSNKELIDVQIGTYERHQTLAYSKSALGNGETEALFDVVYVKPATFNPAKSADIAYSIEKINAALVKEKRNYILIGYGRWGSSDPWLGVPVKWGQISGARVIIESALDKYQIDPSQGTHFFQNLTSLSVGYFTINSYADLGYWDSDFLDNQPAFFEDQFVRHVRFSKPFKVLIDGRKNEGVILKPLPE